MTEGKVVKGEYTNDMGKWIVYDDSTMDIIELSESWIERQKEMEDDNLNQEPSQEERIAALEQALLDLLG